MGTDQLNVLNRLAAGEISPDEATQLLRVSSRPAPPRVQSRTDRWLRIRITDLDTGRQRVNVNLPLSWVEVGLSFGARYNSELAGIDLDEILEQIRNGADGKLVEVEDLDDRERVEIFVD